MRVKVIDKDTVQVYIEKFEDLIGLFIFINPGDVVFGYDYRTIKINEVKKEKIKVFIKIEVEKIKFGQYMDSLRIQGKILEASDIVSGKYHTFDINIGDTINIKKKRLANNDLKFLEKYIINKSGIYVLSVDDRDVALAIVSDTGYRVLYEGRVGIPKDDPEKESIFFKLISNALEKMEDPKIIIISGPMFYPDYVESYIKSKEIINCRLAKIKTSHGGIWGIREVLRRKEFLDIVSNLEISIVNNKISEILKSLDKGLVAIGYDSVKQSIDMGNVEYVLISFDYFRKLKEEGEYEKIIKLIGKLGYISSEYYFVYKDNEYYDFVNKFGVVAKLRYKLDY